MDKVTFADGTEADCSKFLFLPDMRVMFVYLDNANWQNAIDIFSDPEKTKAISYGNVTITGYTNIDYIMPEAGGMKACLSPAR